MACKEITKSTTSNITMVLKSELETVEFYLQRVNIPGIIFGVTEYGNLGTRVKNPGSTIDFERLNFDVLVDRELEVFEELYNEMIEGHNPNTGVLQASKKKFEATIIINSNKNNPILKIMFHDLIIESFGGIDYDATETENVKMSIIATYDYYELQRL